MARRWRRSKARSSESNRVSATACHGSPFRADHVGSLLRPATLRQAFKHFASGELDAAAFRRVQDDSIRAAVRKQEEAGLKVATADGEFRRSSYWARFVERIEGFEVRSAAYKFRDERGREIDFTAPYAVAKLRRVRELALDEFEFLRDTTRVTPKITLPAPSTMHFYAGRQSADPDIYSDLAAFFADLSLVFQGEIADLAAAGVQRVEGYNARIVAGEPIFERRGRRAMPNPPGARRSQWRCAGGGVGHTRRPTGRRCRNRRYNRTSRLP